MKAKFVTLVEIKILNMTSIEELDKLYGSETSEEKLEINDGQICGLIC